VYLGINCKSSDGLESIASARLTKLERAVRFPLELADHPLPEAGKLRLIFRVPLDRSVSRGAAGRPLFTDWTAQVTHFLQPRFMNDAQRQRPVIAVGKLAEYFNY
jgi:hypothetical protein